MPHRTTYPDRKKSWVITKIVWGGGEHILDPPVTVSLNEAVMFSRDTEGRVLINNIAVDFIPPKEASSISIAVFEY